MAVGGGNRRRAKYLILIIVFILFFSVSQFSGFSPTGSSPRSPVIQASGGTALERHENQSLTPSHPPLFHLLLTGFFFFSECAAVDLSTFYFFCSLASFFPSLFGATQSRLL